MRSLSNTDYPLYQLANKLAPVTRAWQAISLDAAG